MQVKFNCFHRAVIVYLMSYSVQEQDDVRLVLKAACDMLAELSAAHNPKNYSNLYAEVFTHLQQLPVRPDLLSKAGFLFVFTHSN